MSRESRSHLDYSDDLAAQVRLAREAAQQELEAFGDASVIVILTQRGEIRRGGEESRTLLGLSHQGRGVSNSTVVSRA
jgi:hypothetical protein